MVEGTLSREEPCALNSGRTILTRFALGGLGLGHVKDALVADALEDRHRLLRVWASRLRNSPKEIGFSFPPQEEAGPEGEAQ